MTPLVEAADVRPDPAGGFTARVTVEATGRTEAAARERLAAHLYGDVWREAALAGFALKGGSAGNPAIPADPAVREACRGLVRIMQLTCSPLYAGTKGDPR